jgi:pimeloyl-ACP methyl ester carboxylesterase
MTPAERTRDAAGRIAWAGRDGFGQTAGVWDAEVRYAKHGHVHLAFSVFGDGRHDLAISNWRYPIDLMWELPQLADFMTALRGMARVIVFDPRGCGASDSHLDPGASTIEEVADDLLAVLDAADCERITLFDYARADRNSVTGPT